MGKSSNAPDSDEKGRFLADNSATLEIVSAKCKGGQAETDKNEVGSHWPSLVLTGLGSFLVALQFSVYLVSLWPFLLLIDKEATIEFFGIITAAFSIGSAVSSPFFGLLAQKLDKTRPVICIGFAICIVGNSLYCFAESFPELYRKWHLLVSRTIVGIGSGVLGVLRAYAATASTSASRHRAISLVTCCFVCGFLVGPGVQLLMTPLGFSPDVNNGTTFLRFHMYTAPSVFAALLGVLVVFAFLFCFEEKRVNLPTLSSNLAQSPSLPNFDRWAAAVCIGTNFAMMAVIINLETILAPYATTMWLWTPEETTRRMGLMVVIMVSLSLFCYGAMMFKLGTVISRLKAERVSVISGLCFILVFHFLTYPWPFFAENQTIFNVSSVANLSESVDWFLETPIVPVWLFQAAYIILLGIGVPLISVSLLTVFSKILGPRRQDFMQGINLFVGNIARAIGPFAVT